LLMINTESQANPLCPRELQTTPLADGKLKLAPVAVVSVLQLFIQGMPFRVAQNE